ncbi:MAG: hypothetical protein P4L99_04605 [Chthoniobacter sp.]|nr:hypothetical protein [Chthoniobacter sp.]
MNIPQKILTAVFIILFVLGTLVVATGTPEPTLPLISVWVVFGVVYTGLFFICASRKEPD